MWKLRESILKSTKKKGKTTPRKKTKRKKIYLINFIL
jgi:hypothetical protein